MPVSLATATEGDACEAAVAAAKVHLEANQQQYSFGAAAAYAWNAVRDACGGRLAVGAAGERGASGDEDCRDRSDDEEDDGEPACEDESGVVGCTLGGFGTGRIKGKVLGARFPAEAAVGEWGGTNETGVTVSGDGTLLGGSQGGDYGTIRIANAIPLPAVGSTSATCLQTVTVEHRTKEDCYAVWFGFAGFWRCTTSVETETNVDVKPCSAAARQTLPIAGMHVDLLTVDHYYELNPNPCRASAKTQAGLDHGTL